MNPVRVTIIADDRLMAEEMRIILEKLGHQVVAPVGDQEKTIQRLGESNPHVILMNIPLSAEANALAITARIKEIKDIPIIYLTALAPQAVLPRTTFPEPNWYILKPFEPRELHLAIAIALYKHQAEKEMASFQDQFNQVQTETKLLEINRQKEELEIALNVILRQRAKDKEEMQEALLANVKHLILPCLERLKNSHLTNEQLEHLGILETYIHNIISPFVRKLSQKYLGLTPTELHIAEMIRDGMQTKEIADALNLSPTTIRSYRENIRSKLALTGKKINLRSYLQTME